MSRNWLIPGEKEVEHRPTDDKEELFVFGYSCKLFRDDEKALFLDRGSHLIPWMGDEKILIDRYDGRGHLYDLSPYDASNVRDVTLTDDEKQMEKLCDEERYLELRTDIQEKITYEEEEWKRYYESLSEGYNAVGFSYEQHQQQQQAAEYAAYQKALKLGEAKPFIVPKELHLPPNIVPPDTEIINARIEKTAKFVALQGAQMEILIKTKQANNEQFNFLHFEDKLNPYYKHMVNMIKAGKYKPKEEKQEAEDSPEKDDGDHSHGYLHPSLMAVKRVTMAPEPVLPQAPKVELPKVSIHDTPYGQLIKTLQRNKEKTEPPKPKEETVTHPEVQQPQNPPGPPPPPIRPPPIPPFMSQPAYTTVHSGLPPPPGLEPVTLPYHEQYHDQYHDQPPPPGTDVEEAYHPMEGPLPTRVSEIQAEVEEEEYSEVSRVSPITTVNQIVPPPPDIQPIIDRMAMYVAKNGIEFEIVVKSKSDPRFEFLLPHHMHHQYYNFKKEIHMREAAKERERKENEKPAKLSFSIKPKPKEADPPPREKKRRVFDNESSDDEGDSERSRSNVSGTSTPVGSDSYQMVEEKPPIPPEEREKKLAEERLKDRLAQGAREKLAQASKEKQIQAERKRKAAMFLNMLKSCNPTQEDKTKETAEGKPSGISTPGTTPSTSPGRGTDLVNYDVTALRSKDREGSMSRSSKRSRSRSPRRKKKRGSRSPTRRRRSPHHKSRSRRDVDGKFVDLTEEGEICSVSENNSTDNISQYSVVNQPSVPFNISLPQEESDTTQGYYDNRVSPTAIDQDDSNSVASDSRSNTDSPRNASNYMLSKVRALIKASREAVLKEEGPLYEDDTTWKRSPARLTCTDDSGTHPQWREISSKTNLHGPQRNTHTMEREISSKTNLHGPQRNTPTMERDLKQD
ncbi:hypothetical protein FSP39_008921 [Pinctada imbricata]|uniref:SURP motif domain-containing protein n=1 Tax=Pinctada imbricata TaxID=66713 RepID=A0AA89BK85_PINIB|nr:hypothetical protein FSP39_008921 [Pinctada imbricata]